MQISIEATGPLEREMTVRIPADQINSAVSDRLAHISRTTRVDGFRKGKVPLKLVERRFGAQVREEVLGDVVRKSFYEAVSSEKLRPAGEPSIEPLPMDDAAATDDFAYKAKFEVYPEIKLSPIEELSLVLPVCEVEEPDIDKMVEKLRKQASHWHVVEAPAATGDRVTMDFFGTIEGHTFEGGEANDFKVELGAGSLIKGFEEALVGASAGQTLELDLQFPNDYHAPNLAGKPVHFRVKVNKVEHPHLAELDDKFFARFGIEEGGMDAFRAEVRQSMERERNQRIQATVKADVVTALLAANVIERPRVLIDDEVRRLHRDAVERLTSQGFPAAATSGLDKKLFEEEANRRVGAGLVMTEIVRNAGLKADPAKVRIVVEGLASSYEDAGRVISWYYEDRQRLAEVESLVLENETVDWILARAKVEERPTSFDALMNPVQTEQST